MICWVEHFSVGCWATDMLGGTFSVGCWATGASIIMLGGTCVFGLEALGQLGRTGCYATHNNIKPGGDGTFGVGFWATSVRNITYGDIVVIGTRLL